MNLRLLGPELFLVGLGLVLILADLVIPPARRRWLGYAAAGGVLALLANALAGLAMLTGAAAQGHAFGGMFVADGLAAFFKVLFLAAGAIVLLLGADAPAGMRGGQTEFQVLTLFALSGMLLAASANHFAVMYVALELITVTFYVLVSYESGRPASLEAGVKYLILGALSSAIMVYGIALCFGAGETMSFDTLGANSEALAGNRLFQLGLLMVLGGLAFKVAVFPFHVWAPDVYEGAPVATTAFLAIGSKAAGVVLFVRLLGTVLPELGWQWESLLGGVAGFSILYGSLCAISQRSLKRLLGYSSIANGGFVMLGLATLSKAGSAAVLYYLAGYLFTVLAAFVVVAVVTRHVGTDDMGALSGLHQRAPLLAAALTLSMVSLAGVPPLAGFFGKFLVLRAVVEQGASYGAYYWLAGVALVGVVISFWYYFGVVRAVYWGGTVSDSVALPVSGTLRVVLGVCIVGILCLGIYPGPFWNAAVAAVASLRL